MLHTRNSKQRELILSLINDEHPHPTADEVYEAAKKIDPKISRGTVYRNLNLLTSLAKLKHLYSLSGPDHYDHSLHDHYHFMCRKCQKVFDASIPYQKELNQTPLDMDGFKTEEHQLLLVGLCPKCLQESDS